MFSIYAGAAISVTILDRTAGDADPDDDRRAPLRDRYRRHGSAGAVQRAGDERPCGRGCRRCRYAAARQDRHDHPRQPAWRQSSCRCPASPRRSLPMRHSSPRSATRHPEGRSIVVLAKEKYGLRERDVASLGAEFIPFTAQTRMSGVDMHGTEIRKGAADAVMQYARSRERRNGDHPVGVDHRGRDDRQGRGNTAGRREGRAGCSA